MFEEKNSLPVSHASNDSVTSTLFEEEQRAWETVLSVTLEIKQSLQKINRKLEVHEQTFLASDL
jgi:hypothetical protein